MNLIVPLLILISAFFHAIWNFYLKKSFNKYIFLWLSFLITTIFYSPIFLYFILKEFTLDFNSAILIWIISTFTFLYFVFMGKAYKYGDLGLAYPIVRSAPIFVLIVAVFFLNEQISTIGFIGIILIVLGTYVLNIESRKSILKIRKNLVKNKKVVFFGLLAALCSAGYTVVSKVGVTLEIEPFIIAYSMFFINILFFSPYILKNRKLIKKELKMNKFSLMAVGILMAFSWIVVLYTLQLTNVSYIASLRQLSLIFGVIFGGIFLKEKKMTIRLTGATLIIIGSILIAMAI